VLFTANPLNGLRSQVVIDATLWLGEALGLGAGGAGPLRVDMLNGRPILEKTLGAKAFSNSLAGRGGTAPSLEEAGALQALPDEQIWRWQSSGSRWRPDYGFPAGHRVGLAGGKLYLLQSRRSPRSTPRPGMPAARWR